MTRNSRDPGSRLSWQVEIARLERLPGLIAVHTLVSKSKYTFPTYTLSKYVSAYTLSLLAPQRELHQVFLWSSSVLVVPYSSVDPCSKLKEVLPLCNANFFFSRIVSYGSPLKNLILGIRIGVGAVAVAASVETRLALLPEARVKLRYRRWKMMIWVSVQNHPQFHCRSWIGTNRSNLDVISVSWSVSWSRNGKGEGETRSFSREET